MKIKLKYRLLNLVLIIVILGNVVTATEDVCREYIDQIKDIDHDAGNYIVATNCYLKKNNIDEAKNCAQKYLDATEKVPKQTETDRWIYFYAKAIVLDDKSYLEEAELMTSNNPNIKEFTNTARVKVFGETIQSEPDREGYDLCMLILALVTGLVMGIVIGIVLTKRK